MKSEQIYQGNIKIAEKCGWRRAKGQMQSWWAPTWMWFKPNEEIPKRLKVFTGNTSLANSSDLDGRPPDYYIDLNAIHQAEKSLTESEFSAYCKMLHEMFCPLKCSSPTCGYAISATSEQRFDTLLKIIAK